MSNEMLELKPCPFCGSPGAICCLEDEPGSPASFWVNCSCGIETRERRTEVEAIALWNTRASALAEPVGFACGVEIGVNRHHLGLSVEPMGVYDTPVYAHPAPAAPVPNLQGKLAGSPAAPVPASVREAAQRLEQACEQLAATRTDAIYLAMIDGGQADALLELDYARRSVRTALASLPAPEAAPAPINQKMLIEKAFKLSCEDQYRMAFFIAENVGYVLAPDPLRGGQAEPEAAPTREEIAKAAFNLAEAVECSVDLDLHPLLKKRVDATKSALKADPAK